MVSLTNIEERQLVALMKKLEPGFLPYDIFVQIARLGTLPILEFVPLRGKSGQVEVLLLHRGKDDPIWPDMEHTPGTVVRATDTEKDIYLAFDRILNDELKGTEVSGPHFVGSILHKSRRGTEHSQVYWIEVVGEPKVGKFYLANKLPANLIESQTRFIKAAVTSFKKAKSI